MKLSRQDPYRRRRSPVSLIAIIFLLAFLALLIFAWMRGGPQPVHPVEKAIPSDQLGK